MNSAWLAGWLRGQPLIWTAEQIEKKNQRPFSWKIKIEGLSSEKDVEAVRGNKFKRPSTKKKKLYGTGSERKKNDWKYFLMVDP